LRNVWPVPRFDKMADFEELEFDIPAYPPETMPLDRLLQYLQQIGDAVGVPEQMHLVRIEPSSTKPVFVMPTPIALQARERAAAVRTGNGTNLQRAAYTSSLSDLSLATLRGA
jgi:hypothetical protein